MNNQINELNLTELETVSGGCGGCAGGKLTVEAPKGIIGDEGFNGNALNQRKTASKMS
ncbi:MAG: hypothetical protein ACREEK_30705 [Bradyrhizobium sp.]